MAWSASPIARCATRRDWRAFKADLQAHAYDAVIDLQGLTKSALVARLARLAPGGKRYALANRTEGSGYEAPTRWLADVAIAIAPHTHAVQRSRELAASALGYHFNPGQATYFGLKVPESHIQMAYHATENIAKAAHRGQSIAFVHGTSRADKQWPLTHWVELGRNLDAAGYSLVLAHGNEAELATSREIARRLGNLNENTDHAVPGRVTVLPLLALDALMTELAECAGVIGVDSGVSHIAMALNLPHVQIYNFDTAWRTGPEALGGPARQLSVYDQPTPGVDAVWAAWQRCLAGAAVAMPAGRC